MLKLIKNLGHIHGADISDTLTMTCEERSKARLKTVTDKGVETGIFLERGRGLISGDVLADENGRMVRVTARPEPVIMAGCSDWMTFARACYHLGNRHVALEVGDRWVCFQPDHVLEDLAQRLGLATQKEMRPFNPENGAYGGHHH